MKIVQINACYGVGSTGIIVRDLQDICINNGIECVVVSPMSDGKEIYIYKIGNILSNKLHALLSRISGKQGYYSILSTLRFLFWLSSYKPDIIHLHNLHGCYISLPLLMRYAKKHKIPVVVTLHDCWFYTGGCSHYTAVACDKWLSQCGHCPLRYHETPAYIFDGSSNILHDRKVLFGNLDKLVGIGVSNWIIEEAQKTVFSNRECFTIYNGIDIDFFQTVDSNFRKKYNLIGKKIILAPANKWFLDINKDTFEYFSSQLTNDIYMVFIGVGCDESRMTDKMINIGYVPSREILRDIYNSADVMVNCTREESLSLLNIEVQACGTPVITYANTGVKETVDGKCGFATANGNYKALWKKTTEVLYKGKSFYQDDCKNWVRINFEKNNNYKKYLEVYNRIVSH